MYKIIDAKEFHADKILKYLTDTCYWKEFVEGNSQNKSYRDFMLEWVVLPRLPITKVLVKNGDEDNPRGCLIAATLERLAEMPDYTPYVHPRVMEVFGSWFSYPISDSMVIELYAVDDELRGKGFGSQFLSIADKLARENNKQCLSCFVWTCFPDSIIVTTKKGFMIKECIKFSNPIEFGLLYMEKTPKSLESKDYFQSPEYSKQKNLLIR